MREDETGDSGYHNKSYSRPKKKIIKGVPLQHNIECACSKLPTNNIYPKKF